MKMKMKMQMKMQMKNRVYPWLLTTYRNGLINRYDDHSSPIMREDPDNQTGRVIYPSLDESGGAKAKRHTNRDTATCLT